jgi:hypothetical protein
MLTVIIVRALTEAALMVVLAQVPTVGMLTLATVDVAQIVKLKQNQASKLA